ncbi:MAG: hypothetical protein Ta2G_10640 [Termitinemataceae bacterium]|nr:MAG: hypothetical protein Ta2G_10640 [Termitinemataceae bacterium]
MREQCAQGERCDLEQHGFLEKYTFKIHQAGLEVYRKDINTDFSDFISFALFTGKTRLYTEKK